MNLQPINPRDVNGQTVTCARCKRPTRLDWPGAVADLDGKSFAAYYCHRCADVLRQCEAVLDEFFAAYLETALWSSNDPDNEGGGVPLDRDHTPDDIDPATREAMRAECLAFLAAGALELIEAEPSPRFGPDYGRWGNAGHNFWLTRNGHGAGFWDGGWPENGDALTELCGWRTPFDERNLYIGDDGKIYQIQG